jgi:hypothetical protein
MRSLLNSRFTLQLDSRGSGADISLDALPIGCMRLLHGTVSIYTYVYTAYSSLLACMRTVLPRKSVVYGVGALCHNPAIAARASRRQFPLDPAQPGADVVQDVASDHSADLVVVGLLLQGAEHILFWQGARMW